jgi:hypothetical protein
MGEAQYAHLKVKLLKVEARRRAAHLADQLADFDRKVDEVAAEPDVDTRTRRFAELEQILSDGLG